ncbi:MAG: hypothetical protein R3F62_31990, partial [Planctomycetota bacterium]
DSQAAREGADRAQSAEASLDQRRADAERDAALAIQDGLGALDEGDAAQAREHLETAQAMQRLLLDEVGATEGDVELTAQLLRLHQGLDRLQGGGGGSAEDPDALERQVRARVQEAEAAARADREQRAGQLVAQGDEALAKSDKGTATQRYLDALALYPEHPDALRGLRAALTPEVEPGSQADSVASWAMDQKEALRADAERARARGEHKRAEERLLQALAFAPRDPQLLAALEAVREQLRREQSGPVGERVASAVSRGEEALERARTATNRGDAALHYLTAQGEFSAALTLDPNRSDLAGELSKIKEEAVELFTPQATVEEAAPTRPDDPHLEFEEGDQVAITRALGHKVRFASPGNTFAALREEVEQVGGGRFRVFLRLRTRAERVPSGGLQSVQVMARGFEVQLEDKQQRLRWPWRFLPFEDGPYPRATRLERDGTVVVSSFFSAQPAAMKNELDRLEALVKGLIEDALRADTR